jgi:hypothetical protein
MRKNLKIADIYLDFTYCYNDYFGDKINAYEFFDESISYQKLVVKVEEEIHLPDRPITLKHENRIKLESEYDTYIAVFVKDEIKYLIYYKNDFSLMEITLNQKIGDRLAEYEYVLSGMVFFDLAVTKNYLSLHASAITLDNLTWLFSGPSTVGKSTQTNHFLAVYPKSEIINEDKPLLYEKDKRFYVCGTPWSGKDVINANLERPLDYVFFLRKGNYLKVSELSVKDKITHIFKNIHRPSEEILLDNTASIVDKLISKVKIYEFENINNQSSARFIKQFMEENHEN